MTSKRITIPEGKRAIILTDATADALYNLCLSLRRSWRGTGKFEVTNDIADLAVEVGFDLMLELNTVETSNG
jgi:hypothetical protein